MTAMTWDQYLQFLMEVEKENVDENYRVGRAANGADEELNRDTRIGFANLQAMMPTLLAAPDLLSALKMCKQALKNYIDSGYDEDEDHEAYAAAVAALRKAEGRTE